MILLGRLVSWITNAFSLIVALGVFSILGSLILIVAWSVVVLAFKAVTGVVFGWVWHV